MDLIPRSEVGVVVRTPIPAIGRNLRYGIHFVEDVLPVGLEMGCLGHQAGHADDRHIAGLFLTMDSDLGQIRLLQLRQPLGALDCDLAVEFLNGAGAVTQCRYLAYHIQTLSMLFLFAQGGKLRYLRILTISGVTFEALGGDPQSAEPNLF